MDILLPGYTIWEQLPGVEGMWRQAEKCARVCYKSEDKMSDDLSTAEPFVRRILLSHPEDPERCHGAMLEHAAVYLKVERYIGSSDSEWGDCCKYKHNHYSTVNYYKDYWYITTNLRVLFENGWMSDLQYWCEPTEYHDKRISVFFTVDRFTGEEFIRHRKASFGRESTRYVNYTKDKFGHTIKFILPPWLHEKYGDVQGIDEQMFREMCIKIGNNDEDGFNDIDYWLFSLYSAEYSYFKLIEKFGWVAQQARTVLPCAISSPLIKTAYIDDWKHFFKLRVIGITGAPHPQAKELALPLYNDFIEKGFINKLD